MAVADDQAALDTLPWITQGHFEGRAEAAPSSDIGHDGDAEQAGPASAVPGEKRRPTCPHCGKTFAQAGSLQAHVRVHTGDRPYACDRCRKSFTQLGALQLHYRTHTGEKPYECEGCGKKFTQRVSLQVHARTHTGEKPFACDFCSRSFTQRGSLQTHLRTHTGDRPYECALCAKRFSQRASLHAHVRTHTGERPFGCEACGESFAQHSSLKLHRHKHHPEAAAGESDGSGTLLDPRPFAAAAAADVVVDPQQLRSWSHGDASVAGDAVVIMSTAAAAGHLAGSRPVLSAAAACHPLPPEVDVARFAWMAAMAQATAAAAARDGGGRLANGASGSLSTAGDGKAALVPSAASGGRTRRTATQECISRRDVTTGAGPAEQPLLYRGDDDGGGDSDDDESRDTTYLCVECGASFSRLLQLTVHQRVHDPASEVKPLQQQQRFGLPAQPMKAAPPSSAAQP